MDWWDSVVNFFTGGGNVADAADNIYDASTFSNVTELISNLWEAENIGTAQSVLEAAGDSGGVVEGVSKMATDAPGTKTLADQVLHSNEGIFGNAAQDAAKAAGGAAKDKGVFSQMVQWVKDLNSDEKKMFFKALEVGGGIAGGVGIAALKGKSQEDAIRLQAELAGQKAYDEQSGVTRAKQDLNKVPAGVPFKPKNGALLSNQMGQPVYNPNNPLVPRPGLIYGGMR